MKKRILVVDDEVDFVDMIKTRLEANDYDVITASDGKEALDRVGADKPDAVLLDIKIPKGDGFSVLKKIKKQNKDIPVFIITAYTNKDRISTSKTLQASGFISKTGNLKKEIENMTNFLKMAQRLKEG